MSRRAHARPHGIARARPDNTKGFRRMEWLAPLPMGVVPAVVGGRVVPAATGIALIADGLAMPCALPLVTSGRRRLPPKE